MSEFWDRVGALFAAAVALPVDQRAAFVTQSNTSEDVRKEVLSLLASHDEATDFLEQPAADLPTEPDQEAPLLAEGTTLGQYRVNRVIGAGGMGVVYEAYDTRLHRPVAFKSLKVSGAEPHRERLKREARAAAGLTHPNIAIVYALEEFDGQLYIVSEYLAGETLRSELERGKFSIDQAIATMMEVARGLCVAHDRGIVHRDLKPENVIRTAEGSVKIVDFGLAQFDEAARDRMSMTWVTQPGMVAGTPNYMAPEQLLGRGTDSRTDHFAFGVMLYELSAGRHPFGRGSLPSTIARILAGEPEPPGKDDHIPNEVWRIIERCLQKNAADRFASTRDLISALESLQAPTARVAPAALEAPAAPAALATPAALEAPEAPAALESPLRWWRFHQFAAALVYWSMVWPAWYVHRSVGRAGLFFFFATLAAVVVAGNLRLHLWFSSRVYPEDLPAQRADVGRWIRVADVAFAALLIIGGIALPAEQAGWAAVLISVGILLAAIFIEPATARAAFRFESRTRTIVNRREEPS